MQSNNGVLQILKIPQQNACVRVSVSKKESQAVIDKAICNMKIDFFISNTFVSSAKLKLTKNSSKC